MSSSNPSSQGFGSNPSSSRQAETTTKEYPLIMGGRVDTKFIGNTEITVRDHYYVLRFPTASAKDDISFARMPQPVHCYKKSINLSNRDLLETNRARWEKELEETTDPKRKLELRKRISKSGYSITDIKREPWIIEDDQSRNRYTTRFTGGQPDAYMVIAMSEDQTTFQARPITDWYDVHRMREYTAIDTDEAERLINEMQKSDKGMRQPSAVRSANEKKEQDEGVVTDGRGNVLDAYGRRTGVAVSAMPVQGSSPKRERDILEEDDVNEEINRSLTLMQEVERESATRMGSSKKEVNVVYQWDYDDDDVDAKPEEDNQDTFGDMDALEFEQLSDDEPEDNKFLRDSPYNDNDDDDDEDGEGFNVPDTLRDVMDEANENDMDEEQRRMRKMVKNARKLTDNVHGDASGDLNVDTRGKDTQHTHTMHEVMLTGASAGSRKRKQDDDQSGVDSGDDDALVDEDDELARQRKKRRKVDGPRKKGVMPTADDIRWVMRKSGGRMLPRDLTTAIGKEFGLKKKWLAKHRAELLDLIRTVVVKENAQSQFLILRT